MKMSGSAETERRDNIVIGEALIEWRGDHPSKTGERMITTLELRGLANQTRFAHDEMVRFWVSTRRDRLLGLWAGELLGHDGEALEAYADAQVRKALIRGDGMAALKAVYSDLTRHAFPYTMSDLVQKWNECRARAHHDVLAQI